MADAMDAPVAVRFVTVAVVSNATPAFIDAIDALVLVRLVTVPVVITATPALMEAIETAGTCKLPMLAEAILAPVAVSEVTVAVVSSATPALIDVMDASEATSVVNAPVAGVVAPTEVLLIVLPVIVALVSVLLETVCAVSSVTAFSAG